MEQIQTSVKLEIWKPVIGYEPYAEVSNLGRVRSLPRAVTFGVGMRNMRGKIMRGWEDGAGYRIVSLANGSGRRFTVRVHVLVLEAFVGPRPQGYDACHGNGDKQDNRSENLRWDTRKANAADAKAAGTTPVGERRWNARLTRQQVAEIRAMHSTGQFSQREIGLCFGIHQTHVGNIVRRRIWQSC